jgi:hypothetical protein
MSYLVVILLVVIEEVDGVAWIQLGKKEKNSVVAGKIKKVIG